MDNLPLHPNDQKKLNEFKPAFPIVSGNDVFTGMSLRDYFAAHASDEDIRQLQSLKPEGYISTQCARYMHADAMLKAREDVKE